MTHGRLHTALRLIIVVAGVALASLPIAAATPAQAGTEQAVIDALVGAMCQKQIVLLGELPTHGEAQAFDAKAKIADRLIEQCGFSAVLFEAPIYDFIGFERAVAARTATPDQLDDAIGRFWLTRELAPWRRSLFEAAAAKRIVIGGLDDQTSITAHYAQATLPGLVAAASPAGTAAACAETVSRHLRWTYDSATPFDEREQVKLQACARDAAGAAAANRSLDAADRAMLASFARYADRQRPGAAASRDDSMFQNLAWHLDRLPANSRVIVWTATVHAAKQRGALADVPMGARAVDRWHDRVAAVGFTAYGGHSSRAARPPSPIADAPPDSLEATTSSGAAWTLLDEKTLTTIGRVPSRLPGKFVTDVWSNYFDAVVVIRQETAPAFDPWK